MSLHFSCYSYYFIQFYRLKIKNCCPEITLFRFCTIKAVNGSTAIYLSSFTICSFESIFIILVFNCHRQICPLCTSRTFFVRAGSKNDLHPVTLSLSIQTVVCNRNPKSKCCRKVKHFGFLV